MVFIPSIATNPWWSNTVSGIRFDPAFDPIEYSIPDYPGITDTGSSCILGPPEPVATIRSWILGTASTVQEDDQWEQLFDCSEIANMPKFEILFGDYWFEVLPEDYVTDIERDNLCSVCIRDDA